MIDSIEKQLDETKTDLTQTQQHLNDNYNNKQMDTQQQDKFNELRKKRT